MPIDHYMPTDHYRALVAALTALKPCPHSGAVEEHQIMEVLGEIGGVWPESLLRSGGEKKPSIEAVA